MNRYITTPIFYVNSRPHIGHLYSALLGDCISRWESMRNKQVLLATGTDEHGQKVYQASLANEKFKENTLQFCTEQSLKFRRLFDRANVQYHKYIRTTDMDHKKYVKEVWNQLLKDGHIYKGTHEGYYCTSEETFIPQSQLILQGDNYVTATGQPVSYVKEENYKFKLLNFLPQVLEWSQHFPFHS